MVAVTSGSAGAVCMRMGRCAAPAGPSAVRHAGDVAVHSLPATCPAVPLLKLPRGPPPPPPPGVTPAGPGPGGGLGAAAGGAARWRAPHRSGAGTAHCRRLWLSLGLWLCWLLLGGAAHACRQAVGKDAARGLPTHMLQAWLPLPARKVPLCAQLLPGQEP